MPDLVLGTLVLVADHRGDHVHVTVLGDGPVGHRPLCGNFVVRRAEWAALEAFATTARNAELELGRSAALRSVLGDWDWPGIAKDLTEQDHEYAGAAAGIARVLEAK